MRRILFVLVGTALIAATLALGSGGTAFGQPVIDFTGANNAFFSEGADNRSPEATQRLQDNYCLEFGHDIDPICEITVQG